MPWIFILIAVIIIIVLLAARNQNHGYTIGSGMFKNSDNNLNKDEHIDASDYDYYNKKGKFK